MVAGALAQIALCLCAAVMSGLLARAFSSGPSSASQVGTAQVKSGHVLAGCIIGMILGPTILGRVAPDWYEQHIIGGREIRIAYHGLISDHEGIELAARSAGMSDRELLELSEAHRESQAALEAQLTMARVDDQRPIRITALTLAGVMLLLFSMPGTRPTSPSNPDVMTVISVGLWSAALPGATAALVLTWTGVPMSMAIAAGAALAIGPTVLRGRDASFAEEAEPGGHRMIEAAGLLASAVSLGTAAALLFNAGMIGHAHTLLPLTAIPLGRLLGPALLRWTAAAPSVLSAVIAITLLRIDVLMHTAVWSVVIVMLLSADGRWLGALAGAAFAAARGWLRGGRLVLGAAAAGPGQLVMLVVLFEARLIDESIALALLAGVVMIELTAPLRWRTARDMREMESLLQQHPMDDDD